MPKIDAKFDLGLFGVAFWGCFDLAGFFFGWIELSQFDSFCSAGISYPSGFVFPFALWGVGV